MYEEIEALKKSCNLKSDFFKKCDEFVYSKEDLTWLTKFFRKNYFNQGIDFKRNKFVIALEGQKEIFLVRTLNDSYVQIDCFTDINNPKVKRTMIVNRSFTLEDNTYLAQVVYSRIYDSYSPEKKKWYLELSNNMIDFAFMGTFFCSSYGEENLKSYKCGKKRRYCPKLDAREGYTWVNSYKKGNTNVAGYWRKK